MNATFALIAVAALGVDVGWQPLEEGGVEYIIQIEPNNVDRMVKLDDLVSEVPKGLDIRRYRITIGTEKLPRKSGKTAAAKPPGSEKPALPDSASPSSASPKRELIAEGAIPAAASEPVKVKEAPQESPKSATATPDAAEVTPDEPTEPAEVEGPILPPAETTTQKPVTDTFAEPEPQDEEGGDSTASQSRDRSATTGGDALFKSPATRPMKSRYVDEPVEERTSRAPARSSRYTEEADENYEAQKRPALSTAMRTSQVDAPIGSSFDRNSGSNETSWIVAIFFVLLLSAGLNMYLFWIAHEARVRYQALLEKYRSSGEPVVDIV